LKTEKQFSSKMTDSNREKKLLGWKDAVSRTLSNK
jgi:glycerol kinase